MELRGRLTALRRAQHLGVCAEHNHEARNVDAPGVGGAGAKGACCAFEQHTGSVRVAAAPMGVTGADLGERLEEALIGSALPLTPGSLPGFVGEKASTPMA